MRWFFLSFRNGIHESHAVIFTGTESGNEETITDGDFAERWGWYGVMHRLCNQKIYRLESITKLNLLECLTWLSYETDLNLSKTVNRDDSE